MPHRIALDTRRPFTRAQALAAGITPRQLRGPSYRQLFRNVHIRSDVVLLPSVRVQGALVLHPSSAFASHHSAAEVYGLPVPDSHEVHVSVVAKEHRRRRDGIRHHLARASARVVTHLGVRVSAPVQLFIEMTECANLVDLVVLGDALAKRGLATTEQLRKASEAVTGRRGDLARRAAGLVRRDVDSPMESRLRLLIVLAGLPEPTVNHMVRRADGSVKLRFDLSYPVLRLVVEYDGRQHRDDLNQWDRDLERDDWFDEVGWRVVKVVSRGIYRRPDETVRRVHDALLARGCRDVPRLLSDEWRAYFPIRP